VTHISGGLEGSSQRTPRTLAPPSTGHGPPRDPAAGSGGGDAPKGPEVRVRNTPTLASSWFSRCLISHEQPARARARPLLLPDPAPVLNLPRPIPISIPHPSPILSPSPSPSPSPPPPFPLPVYVPVYDATEASRLFRRVASHRRRLDGADVAAKRRKTSAAAAAEGATPGEVDASLERFEYAAPSAILSDAGGAWRKISSHVVQRILSAERAAWPEAGAARRRHCLPACLRRRNHSCHCANPRRLLHSRLRRRRRPPPSAPAPPPVCLASFDK